MNTKRDLFLLAKCLEEEHRLQKRIQALREKRLKQSRWSWSEWREHCLIIAGSLAEVIAIEPEVKPTWHTYPCDDGSRKGYHVYGPVHLGEVRKGFHAWLKHETAPVVIQEPTKAAEAPAGEEVAA